MIGTDNLLSISDLLWIRNPSHSEWRKVVGCGVTADSSNINVIPLSSGGYYRWMLHWALYRLNDSTNSSLIKWEIELFPDAKDGSKYSLSSRARWKQHYPRDVTRLTTRNSCRIDPHNKDSRPVPHYGLAVSEPRDKVRCGWKQPNPRWSASSKACIWDTPPEIYSRDTRQPKHVYLKLTNFLQLQSFFSVPCFLLRPMLLLKLYYRHRSAFTAVIQLSSPSRKVPALRFSFELECDSPEQVYDIVSLGGESDNNRWKSWRKVSWTSDRHRLLRCPHLFVVPHELMKF